MHIIFGLKRTLVHKPRALRVAANAISNRMHGECDRVFFIVKP